jgi:L-amino acid N-acyltransferase YncA
MEVTIRRATEADVTRITEVYNHWITATHTSFDLDPQTLDTQDVHRAIALTALPNQPSVDLDADLGYRTVGTLTEVGRKFDRHWSVEVMERAVG